MKKNIIALAVASAIAAPVAMADAPTVYGQINMAAEQYSVEDGGVGVANGADNDLKSGSQVNSRASRIGIKGSEDLGNGLKAIYKAEFEVQIDEGSTLKNRNQYVGLAGGFGTVLMGRHDTPTKMIQGKDFFNDAPLADIGKMADGLGLEGKGMENRFSNVLAYVSPEFAGVKLIGAFIPKENTGDATTESSFSDLYSVALSYGSAKKGLYLAVGMDAASDAITGGATGAGEEAQHVRVVAQYAAGNLIANAMYQDFSGDALENTVKEGTTYSMGLGYKMGNLMPKVQVMNIDRNKDAAGKKFEDSTNYAVGLDYSFGKKTTGYVEYAMIENQAYNIGNKEDPVMTNIDSKGETSAISVGIVHKF
jgi:predicted porin